MDFDVSRLPVEILRLIFLETDAEAFFLCRRVCKRFKDVIDSIPKTNALWSTFCWREFPHYEEIFKKNSLNYEDFYKNIRLWPRLVTAWNSYDCILNKDLEAERNILLHLYKDTLTVVQKCYLRQYNMRTSVVETNRLVTGCLKDFQENRYVRVYEYDESLVFIRKYQFTPNGENHEILGVVSYCLSDNICYYVNQTQQIMQYDTYDNTTKLLAHPHTQGNILSMSCFNGVLWCLTTHGKLFTYEKQHCVEVDEVQLPAALSYSEFLREGVFYYVCQSDLHIYCRGKIATYKIFTSAIKLHGNVLLIGTMQGELLLFYIKKDDDFLHLNMDRPLMPYSLLMPDLEIHPIISIEVAELEAGPKIFISTESKVMNITVEYESEYSMAANWTEETFLKALTVLHL